MASCFCLRDERDEVFAERVVHALPTEPQGRSSTLVPTTTQNTWNLLSEAFVRYYCSQFNQSAESRYYSAKRNDKEHVCDYLNRLNGYARNAGVQFENGGRKARDHVKWFLETCGDRELERRVGHLRITDIHELEEMIVEMLKIDERNTGRGQLQSRSRDASRRRDDRRIDDSRRRDDRRNDDSRRGYDSRDRRERSYERRRDDSRNMPRVSLADASMDDLLAEIQGRGDRNARGELTSTRGRAYSDESSDGESDRGSINSWGADSDLSDGYLSEEDGRYLAAANDQDRRAAADGTYARSENRQHRGDRGFNRGSRPDNRQHGQDGRPRQQYGPCAACGGMSHSAHFC